MRNSRRFNSEGFQPMPAFCVQPNRSPLGASRSNSSVRGSAPVGPAAVVCTSRTAGSDSTSAAKGDFVMACSAIARLFLHGVLSTVSYGRNTHRMRESIMHLLRPNRRELLKMSAGSLLAAGLWPGALAAEGESSGKEFWFIEVDRKS